MASFPDSLPPEGLALEFKYLIYFGILYILTTAITTWLITRRRSVPKTIEVSSASPTQTPAEQQSSAQVPLSMTQALNFADTKDRLSSMKIEVQGAEAALLKLKEVEKNDQISPEAYMKLSARYNEIVNRIKSEMNLMLQADIETSSGEIDSGITEDEMEAIEADLEQQLLELDNDDSFLKTRPKKDLDDVIVDDKPAQPTPVATPVATPPKEQKRVPMPPPPKKGGIPSPPSASSAEASQKTAANEKSSMIPPPPKKAQAPPPPSTAGKSSPPKATPPAAQPSASQPLSAAQPMKVETEENDGMFAKSTSIAALRMDMLRELARLKKLIPEDQDKDQ